MPPFPWSKTFLWVFKKPYERGAPALGTESIRMLLEHCAKTNTSEKVD